MSRGPGKWQREILSAVTKHGAVWIKSLLPVTGCRSDHVALLRAANRLNESGQIDLTHWVCGATTRCFVSAHRPGYVPARRSIVYVLNEFDSGTDSTLKNAP
jgi:hypothetical protein